MKKIFIPLFLLLLISLFYGFYMQLTKKQNNKRLICQEKTITFEKINSSSSIKEAIELLKTNNIVIKSNIEYSKYMPSHLISVLSLEQANSILRNVLENYYLDGKVYPQKLLVDYYIYENDKEDKNKTNAKAKVYAGYIVFEFKFNNKLVYKIQTDYINIDAKDLEERFKCVIDSFVSI